MSENESRFQRLEDLTPDGENANEGTARGASALETSIEIFGAGRSILADSEGTVLAGNKTLEQAVAAGLKPRFIHTRGDELVVVVRDDLSLKDDPAKARGIAYADNRVGELSLKWDTERIKADLDEGLQLQPVFFTQEEIAEIFGDQQAAKTESKKGQTDPDSVPSVTHTAIKTGDLFQLGRHLLLCGDSTNPESYNRVLGNNKADLCLTDTPYGIGENYESFKDSRENLIALIDAFFALARNRSNAMLVTPGNANQYLFPTPDWTLCWVVPAGTGSGPWGFSCWQPVLAYGKDPYLAAGKGRHPDLLNKTESADNTLNHPCPKPVGVWQWFMERGTVKKQSVVLDPFCGSGTSLIAAEQCDRVVCAIELEPKYVQVTINRWEAYTGEKAIKL